MNILIGFITAAVILLLFSRVERKRVKPSGKIKLLFFLFVIFCAYLYKPSDSVLLWVGFASLLYCVLDDMATRTVNIYIPLAATVFFMFFQRNLYSIAESACFFLFFLLIAKISKENWIGEGDAYALLPLLLFLDLNQSFSCLFFAFFFGASFSVGYLFWRHIRKTQTDFSFPFIPFLALSFFVVFADWHADILLPASFVLCLLSLPFAAFLLVKKNASETPPNGK